MLSNPHAHPTPLGIFLGLRIPKGKHTSNWAAQRLSPQQIEYAATDAWACLENGTFPDLGVRKAQAILEKLGMELTLKPLRRRPEADFVGMACASASVSYKVALAPDELVHALLSGKPAPGKEAHFITLIEESRPALLRGLVRQVGAWTKPGKVEKNLRKIANELGVSSRKLAWLKTA